MSELSTQTNPNYNIEAHYSKDTKIMRPKISVAQPPSSLPQKHLFSEKEAQVKMDKINTDIYQGTKKEKSKYEFNKSLYFKIFGGVGLAVAGIAGFDRIRKFFRKS